MTEESIVNNPQGFVNSFSKEIANVLQQNGGSVRSRGGAKGKIGMNELQNIVVNLYRDVKRVKKAITPQGAQAMVDKHNAKSKPSAHWQLHTEDINADGVPDIIIRNQKGDPLYVNGYTTVKSDLPFQQAYSQYLLDNPDKNSRDHKSKRDFIRNGLYKTRYVEEGDEGAEPNTYGNVASAEKPEWYDAVANSKKYKMNEPKRLTAYQRFQHYILKPICDSLMDGRGITGVDKLKLFAKLSGQLWNNFVVEPAVKAADPDATKEDIEKAKKSKKWKPIFDHLVTEYISKIKSDQNTFGEFADHIDMAITDIIEGVDDYLA